MPDKPIKLDRVSVLFSGGMAKLTLGVGRDGAQLVIRELLRRNLFRFRVHRGFIRGTHVRQQLSSHPNIAASVERGYNGLVPYEIIEYVPGSNLRKMIQTRNQQVRQNSIEILRQAAAALAHVHANGIIHLDIKAENLLVDTTGGKIVVKLTDFDLSRDAHSTRLRRCGGTEVYMAPEQLRHGQLGLEADIFSFGVMAYDLVTGRMPFQGKTRRERRWQQMSESFKVTEPIALFPDLAPKLNWLILRCLEKNPVKRLPSMSYLCKELREF